MFLSQELAHSNSLHEEIFAKSQAALAARL